MRGGGRSRIGRRSKREEGEEGEEDGEDEGEGSAWCGVSRGEGFFGGWGGDGAVRPKERGCRGGRPIIWGDVGGCQPRLGWRWRD